MTDTNTKALLKRTIPHEVSIPLSGEDIADLFWDLDEREQADFFNRLYDKDRLVFQLQAVTDAENLTSAGRSAMARIGEYSDAHPDPIREKLVEAVTKALSSELGGDVYDCTRVWEAWQVGTMDSNDFCPVTDRLDSIVESVVSALTLAGQSHE